MNQEIKQQWIAALRSRAYVQGTGMLREHDTYCVYGVLCDLHSKATKTPWQPTWNLIDYEYMGHSGVVNFIVRAWCELEGRGRWSLLYDLNDDGKTFEELADWIDVNL